MAEVIGIKMKLGENIPDATEYGKQPTKFLHGGY
jgi:hypothetical protein